MYSTSAGVCACAAVWCKINRNSCLISQAQRLIPEAVQFGQAHI